MSGPNQPSCSLLYDSPQELDHLDAQRTSLYFIGVTVQTGPGEQEVENILRALVSHMHFRGLEINPHASLEVFHTMNFLGTQGSKKKDSRKTSTSALLTTAKPLIV